MPLVSRTFDQLIDFTRTSSATFVGSNGLIQSTPQSRNLLTFTEEFDNAAWTKTNATVTANSTAAPDGTMTADTLTASAGTVWPQLSNGTVGTVNATVYTASYFVRPGTHTFVQLAVSSQAADWCNFTLTGNGSVQNNGSAVGTISYNSATGWYRISMVYTAGGTNRTPILTLVPSGTASRGQTGTYAGTETVFIWGAQFELGSAATDYTRNFGGLFPPRFDYDPVTLAPRGLLIEEQRTNLLLRSEEFDNASWTLQRSTVTANATTSPDGTVNADRLVDDTATGTHRIFQGAAKAASAIAYTASVYIKADTLGFATFRIAGAGEAAFTSVGINLTTGGLSALSTVGFTSASATVTNAGNGWWRLQLTGTSDTTTSISAIVGTANSLAANSSYTGTGSGSIYVWGAQLEAGAFATSYIPTVASQVTRTGDSALIQAPNFAPWFNATQGTLFVEATTSARVSAVAVLENVVSFSNTLAIVRGASSQALGWFIGSAVFQSFGITSANFTFKSAGAYKAGDNAAVINGGAPVTDAGSTYGTLNALGIGCNTAGGQPFNGHIRSIRYYPVRLSNAQLQALTA